MGFSEEELADILSGAETVEGGILPAKIAWYRVISMDRDLNAAMNLRNKAASYAVPACGEEGSGHSITVTKPASVKQEAISLDFA